MALCFGSITRLPTSLGLSKSVTGQSDKLVGSGRLRAIIGIGSREWRPRAGFGRTRINDGLTEWVVPRRLDPGLGDSASCTNDS